MEPIFDFVKDLKEEPLRIAIKDLRTTGEIPKRVVGRTLKRHDRRKLQPRDRGFTMVFGLSGG